MKPKMKFANRSGIPYVALVGDSEAEEGKVMLKNMESGEQELLTPAEVAAKLVK